MFSQDYRPLPNYLVLKESPIEGLGIFTISDLPDTLFVGITHIKDESGNFHSDLIRTPLGGFLNHSETPNCKIRQFGIYYGLQLIRDVVAEEELTVDYRNAICGINYSFIKKQC